MNDILKFKKVPDIHYRLPNDNFKARRLLKDTSDWENPLLVDINKHISINNGNIGLDDVNHIVNYYRYFGYHYLPDSFSNSKNDVSYMNIRRCHSKYSFKSRNEFEKYVETIEQSNYFTNYIRSISNIDDIITKFPPKTNIIENGFIINNIKMKQKSFYGFETNNCHHSYFISEDNKFYIYDHKFNNKFVKWTDKDKNGHSHPIFTNHGLMTFEKWKETKTLYHSPVDFCQPGIYPDVPIRPVDVTTGHVGDFFALSEDKIVEMAMFYFRKYGV